MINNRYLANNLTLMKTCLYVTDLYIEIYRIYINLLHINLVGFHSNLMLLQHRLATISSSVCYFTMCFCVMPISRRLLVVNRQSQRAPVQMDYARQSLSMRGLQSDKLSAAHRNHWNSRRHSRTELGNLEN